MSGDVTAGDLAAAPDRAGERWWTRPFARALLLLGFLAYVPALTAAPGRMPADSKLYLYLDPGRLMADALGTFDPRQFAGWVPHQHISFLWPSGPWFWIFEQVGVPDWIAHRLWIGTLMLAAGLGVRWCARLLGLTPLAALVAAVVYQVSPYVLPYVSRTSVMLLPWAGLGWITALTIRATRRRRGGLVAWYDPALIALVVLTVGAVNATALAMIVPAPVLWLIHAAWARTCTWRTAVAVAGRTALLAAGVSLWWVAALAIQGRYGADVLPYSESLADVSFTATAAEVWRGLGYWLFYIRDPYAATTTESLRYLWSTPAILISFVVPIVALFAIVRVRWMHRRFAALLITTGLVLAVGVHPIDGRSPLMRLLTGDGESGLALALRSSTRALPVMNLGLALAIGSLVAALAQVRWRPAVSRRVGVGAVGAIGVVVLVLANVPGLWTGAFVDPALERDQDPPDAWLAAADHLDAAESSGRVLMVPGTEFGAYRWGYTVDQPLPGLIDRDVVTRDLLPLGSPAAMDLLYAFDDRIQDGVAESESVATIARLFGADTVWLTNDIAFDRFRLTRPEVVRELVLGSPAVVAVEGFGGPTLNRPDVPMADERSLGDPTVGQSHPPVEIVSLDVGDNLVRAYDRTVVLAGSGDGIVDAAAAGMLPDDVGIRYAADDPSEWPSDVGALITDSNRDRARHWRSSQDTTGFTESGGTADDLLRPVASDARLPVFGDGEPDPSDQTIALQEGPVTAIASAYGEPFAYLPEHRAAMAIDGDPTTAWLVGEHGDPIGESIELSFPDGAPTGEVRLRQPTTLGQRRVTTINLSVRVPLDADNGGDELVEIGEVDLSLDADGWSQPIGLPDGATSLRVTITGVSVETAGTAGAVAGVGFSEVDLGLEPTLEVVRPPLFTVADDTPLAVALTRWRVDPMDRWRSDPEPTLVRRIELDDNRAMSPSYTVRIDPRASDTELAELFGWPVVATTRLTGSLWTPGVAAFDGDPATTWTTAFGEALGARVDIDGVTAPVTELSVSQPVAGISRITEIEVAGGGVVERAELVPDAAGVSRVTLDRPVPAGPVSITVTAIEPAVTTDRRFADTVELPVAVGEIAFDGAPRVEPLTATRLDTGCVELGAIDGVAFAAEISIVDDGWLAGRPIVATPCGGPIELSAGSHLLRSIDGVFQLDRIVLEDRLRTALAGDDEGLSTVPTVETIDASRRGGTYRVSGCADGCWFVYGYGWNEAWSATVDGVDADGPALLDGGFNGWWIEPTDGPVVIVVAWGAQRLLTVAIALSLLTVAVTLAICISALLRRRHAEPEPVDEPLDERVVGPVFADLERSPDRGRLTRPAAIGTGVLWCALGGLLIGPWGAVWGAIAGLVLSVTRRRALPAVVAIASVVAVALFVTVNERRWSPPPDGGWPHRFESVHALGMFAAVSLLLAAILADDTTHTNGTSGTEPSATPDAAVRSGR